MNNAMHIDPIPSEKEILTFMQAVVQPGFQQAMYNVPHRRNLLSRVQRILTVLLPFAPRVLEVGCAEGLVSEWVAERCESLVGLDLLPVGIQRARARKIDNARFEVMDLGELTPDFGQFDLVMACDVLEHLRDPEDFVATARLMGTAILATTPINEDPNERAFSVEAAANPKKNGDGSGHIWSFREATFRALFEEVLWYEDNGVTALVVGR